MEKGIRAFFYDYKYYLIPDDVSSVKELKSRSTIATKRLKEEFCMAPDFIYESIVDETVEIDDGNRIFEVFVNLYSKDEYDAVLREQVDRVCPGCEYYDATDNGSLDGHHREISLTGTCYIRQDENAKYDYSDLFDWYWREVSARLNELAECIDKNDQGKLNEILNENLTKFFYETEFVGTVIDGKYTLCIVNHYSMPHALLSLHNIIARAAMGDTCAMKKAGWKVLPYRPSGVPFHGMQNDCETAVIKFDPLHGDVVPCSMLLYHPNADELDEREKITLVDEIYDGLVYELGETYVLEAIEGFSFTDDETGLMSVRQIAQKILAHVDNDVDIKADDMFPKRESYKPCVDMTDIALPYRQKLREGITQCDDLSCLIKDMDEEDCWWKRVASFAYLFVPRQMDDIEYPMSVLSRYFSEMNNVPVPIRDPDDSRMVGTTIGIGDCGEDGYVVDHMIVSEKAFFRKLRILAPVLKAYGAKVIIVNKDGIAAYDCDYEFTQCQP